MTYRCTKRSAQHVSPAVCMVARVMPFAVSKPQIAQSITFSAFAAPIAHARCKLESLPSVLQR